MPRQPPVRGQAPLGQDTQRPPVARRRAARRRDGSDPVKDGHFARKYRRIKARSGRKIAIGAIKHAILIALFHMLTNGELYRPPTPNPEAERKQRERTTKRLLAQLERLGHTVTLTDGAPPT